MVDDAGKGLPLGPAISQAGPPASCHVRGPAVSLAGSGGAARGHDPTGHQRQSLLLYPEPAEGRILKLVHTIADLACRQQAPEATPSGSPGFGEIKRSGIMTSAKQCLGLVAESRECQGERTKNGMPPMIATSDRSKKS